MILLDTHVWVRWLDPEVRPLPRGVLGRIETADQLAVTSQQEMALTLSLLVATHDCG